MGRIVWDELHFILLLLLAMFILRAGKEMLDENGATYKVITYLIH